ncbi:RNA polymerase, sigma subunit, RpoX/SigF [Tissierella praeacuta DSM 18095]|uniref:RNA polymerase sigma factor n=1 Tax=Tissierella praeacuta DSM 18095 TaxID=1123404 RepID=A0A1M4SXF7_9FIRM|nr:RNA polymerase sporulation sigma factor SigF [Tissierella praeacuta]TCU70744.1 RNA polymerase sigma (RpoX/SigF) subunit [Tissierella praeacuta]SHE36858.1 RNA polymerase, sigma subunit, RpoX/SigF [Tissierella praeacuta DSM 18095]SUP01860.1 Stage II sporulation protein AC [Tissierella praeacuta]
MSLGSENKALLSHEKTMELIKEAQDGSMEAKEMLVSSNLGLIRSVLRGFMNRGYEVDDLFQIGSIGLLKAIDKFDTSFDVRFSTYAVPMIIGEIKRFLRDDGLVKVSRSLKQTASKAKGAEEKLFMQLGREPTIQEISDEIQMDKEDIVMALEASYHPEYLYDVVHQNDGSPLYLIDKISNESEDDRDIVDNIVLKDMLAKLKPRDRQVIILRYFKDKTQTEVASELGISQVQVSRIEKKIIEEMRKNLAKA